MWWPGRTSLFQRFLQLAQVFRLPSLWQPKRPPKMEEPLETEPLEDNMDLNQVVKARKEVDIAISNLTEIMYGPGINRNWVCFMDRLDANSDMRLVAFAVSDSMTSWELNGLSRQAFPMIERFVESLM
jgi:hypothetical protein